MRVVSNASPLINLARVGRLDLLQQLYGELLIPHAVWQETVIAGAGKPGADQIKNAHWLTRTSHQLPAETADMALSASLRSISLLDVSQRIRLRGLQSQASHSEPSRRFRFESQ